MTETPNNQEYEERINEVDQYIRDNISQSLNREVLAAVAGFSVPHFHRIFTAQKGENVAAYVRRIRLERAWLEAPHGCSRHHRSCPGGRI